MRNDLEEIKVYAEHYHAPITDIKGFNKLLKEQGYKSVKRNTLKKLLGY